MKKYFNSLIIFGTLICTNSIAQTTNYSLESEGHIYALNNSGDYKRFCKESVAAQISTDTIGQHVIENSCKYNYFSFNLLQNWGEELYKIAMSNPVPTSYNYTFPFGTSPNEKLMAYSILKDIMFWTSVERFGALNPNSKKQKQIPVSESQFTFFKNVFQKLKSNDAKIHVPVTHTTLNIKQYPFEKLSKSQGYINYTQGLINSKKESLEFEKSLDIVFKSFKNYQEYLNYLYNGEIEEIVADPQSFRNHKFTEIQCVATKLAITSITFNELVKKFNFQCV